LGIGQNTERHGTPFRHFKKEGGKKLNGKKIRTGRALIKD